MASAAISRATSFNQGHSNKQQQPQGTTSENKKSAAAPQLRPNSCLRGSIDATKYKTKPCRNFAEGTCQFGDACAFVHTEEEARPLPPPDARKNRQQAMAAVAAFMMANAIAKANSEAASSKEATAATTPVNHFADVSAADRHVEKVETSIPPMPQTHTVRTTNQPVAPSKSPRGASKGPAIASQTAVAPPPPPPAAGPTPSGLQIPQPRSMAAVVAALSFPSSASAAAGHQNTTTHHPSPHALSKSSSSSVHAGASASSSHSQQHHPIAGTSESSQQQQPLPPPPPSYSSFVTTAQHHHTDMSATGGAPLPYDDYLTQPSTPNMADSYYFHAMTHEHGGAFGTGAPHAHNSSTEHVTSASMSPTQQHAAGGAAGGFPSTTALRYPSFPQGSGSTSFFGAASHHAPYSSPPDSNGSDDEERHAYARRFRYEPYSPVESMVFV